MSIKKIYLELTDRCNLDCKICYRKSWGQPFCDIKEEVLNKLICEFEEYNELKEIVIGGIGEPTCSLQFKRALELLKDYKITVTTNGTLIDEALAEYLVKYVDVVTISVDGLEEKFKEIRGIDLDKVINNIKLLNNMKNKYSSKTPLIDMQLVLSTENQNQIFNVIDLASDLRANKLIISNIIPQSEDNKDKIMYRRYENKDLKNLFDKAMVKGLRKGIKVDVPSYELKTIRRCNFVEGSAAFICASGDVAPCYRFSHSYTEYVFGREKHIHKFAFGNIEKDTLADIWGNTEYVNFRKRIINNQYPSCIDCDLVDGCDNTANLDEDCYALVPSCGDCLWSREFSKCP